MRPNQMVYLVHLHPVISSKSLHPTLHLRLVISSRRLNPIISFKRPKLTVCFRSQLNLPKIQVVCLEVNQDRTLSLAYSKPLRILKHNQIRSHPVKVYSTTKPHLTRTQKKQREVISSEKLALCSMDRTNRQSLKESSQQSNNLLYHSDQILR